MSKEASSLATHIDFKQLIPRAALTWTLEIPCWILDIPLDIPCWILDISKVHPALRFQIVQIAT